MDSNGVGWAGCSDGEVMRYVGGGWGLVNTIFDAPVTAIYGFDTEQCWAGTMRAETYFRDSRGWEKRECPARDPIRDFAFPSTELGWAVTDAGGIVHFQE